MNLWTTTILFGSLLSTNLQITNAQSQYAEESFLNYCNRFGNITFAADPPSFCRFMRPRERVYVGYAPMAESYIDFSFVEGRCTADLIQCNYSSSFEGGSEEHEFYSEGPNGKYYEMAMSPNKLLHWAIYQRVWRPNIYHEEWFYNRYQNVPNEVPFQTNAGNFCLGQTPWYARRRVAPTSEDVDLWVKMIEHKAGERIKIEVRKCGHMLPNDQTEYSYYASDTDGFYYEVRRWDFKNNENEAWVLWDKAL